MKKLILVLSILIWSLKAFPDVAPTHYSFSVESHSPNTGYGNGLIGYVFMCGAGIYHGVADAGMDSFNVITDFFDFTFLPSGTSVWPGVERRIWTAPNYWRTYFFGFEGENIPLDNLSLTSPDIHGGDKKYQQRITNFTLDLGSKRYGAEWFVDMCHYRLQDVSDVPGGITASVIGIDGIGETEGNIQIKVSTQTFCDGFTIGGVSQEFPLLIGITDLGMTPTTGNEQKCVTRFYFKENSNLIREGHLGGGFEVHTSYDIW